MKKEKNAIAAVLNPATPGDQDDFTDLMRSELGFIGAKKLDDGGYVGVQRLLYTIAICVGVTEKSPFAQRYCYDNGAEALSNYQSIQSSDFQFQGYVAKRP